jgi:uncharacterized protein DUF4340
MSPRQLKLIAIGLAVLLLLWGGSELLSHGSDTVTGSLALPAVSAADVDTVSVVKGADSILVARQRPDTAWRVNGRPATPGAVAELLQALRDTVPPELVAQDPSSFTRLGVDSAGGRWLRIRSGAKPGLTLIVGGRGSDYQSAYVRRPGDARVYLWRSRVASLVDRDADGWRDKRIAALTPDSIVALDVQRGKERYTLKRAGKAWTLSTGVADSAAVARYLDRLKTITAAGFAAPKDVTAPKTAHAVRRLSVRGTHGALVSLVFDSSAAGFLARQAGGGDSATVYRMNTWDVDGLTPASRSLLPAKK